MSLGTVGIFLLGALVFVLIFSLLIIVHELGHFLMARLGRVKVEEFGFGLPPKLWGHKTTRNVETLDAKGKLQKTSETMEWTLNAIPFGGFVRMLGEDSLDPKAKNDPRAFLNRPLLWRMAVTIAGVTMNFILAFILFAFLFGFGFRPLIDPNLSFHPRFEPYFSDNHLAEWVEKGIYLNKEGAFLLAVDPAGAAQKAGLEPGDQILSINGTAVQTRAEVQALQQNIAADATWTYQIRRFDPELKTSTDLTLDLTPQDAGDGRKVIGVILVDTFYFPLHDVEVPLAEIPAEAWGQLERYIRLSWSTVKSITASTFGRIFQLQAPSVPSEIGGPVAIWSSTQELVQIGDISKILQFAAVLSLSLAVLNLMPFPALDGGRLIFQIFEGLLLICTWPLKKLFPQKKIPRRLPPKFEGVIHMTGYIILLIFIVVVTWNDVSKIF